MYRSVFWLKTLKQLTYSSSTMEMIKSLHVEKLKLWLFWERKKCLDVYVVQRLDGYIYMCIMLRCIHLHCLDVYVVLEET